MTLVEKIVEELNHITDGQAILYDGLEEALVGVCRRFDHPPVALYSYNKCVQILMQNLEEEDLTEEDRYHQAVEWLEFNTLGLWAGEYTPAFIQDEEF